MDTKNTALLDALADTLSATKEPSGELTLRPAERATQKTSTQTDKTAPGAPSNDFERRGVIGEGGLGKVELFWQRSLQRELAVKSVRDDQVSALTIRALLDEACVTGALEHPGIIPVHALLQNQEGYPGFAMKRVEGRSWHDLIYQASNDEEARLQRHLEIISQLCNTLHFAHRRGFLHRDVKPRNVMVGDFGEVYLLDWGLALPWQQAPNKGLFGTLQYMAPEMLHPTLPLGPHTDVYLLGACLHEVLLREPPHQGDSVRALLQSISSEAPRVYPPSVPYELAQLCNKAMHADPSQRFSSAAELRQALQAFLLHRGSDKLASSAPLGKLCEAISSEQSTDAQRRKLFVECRFALEQALAQWPENEVARTMLRACLTEMFQYELLVGNLAGAEALLAELPTPPDGARERLAKLQREATKEKANLKELAFQFNPSASRGHRSLIGLLCVFFFSVLSGVLVFIGPETILHDRFLLFAMPLAFLLGFGAILFFLRRSLLLNLLNKYMMALVIIADGLMVVNRGFAVVSDTPIQYVMTMDLLLTAGVLAIFSVTVSTWFWRLVVLNGLAAILAILLPRYSFLCLSLSLELSFLWVFLSNNKYATSYQSQLVQSTQPKPQ